ncbi:unnamed protein product [Schistosoma turkestanicum]|nr:unnamed protein product [Schistosoma turkestanicum]
MNLPQKYNNHSIQMIRTDQSLIFPINNNNYSNNNNKLLTSYQSMEPVEIYLPSIIVLTIFLILISMIGIIGNSFVVWAFRKQIQQGIISGLFILLLACNDLFICIIVIPCTLYLDIWTADTTDWICRVHLTLKAFVVPISACILMLIAVERFLLICFIPGIQMKRIHIILSLIIILIIGLLCSIPMGLHVHAIDIFKERDELLDLNTLKNGAIDLSHLQTNQQWFNQLRVTKRCDKDDTLINDQFYWYYQLCVLLLFLGLFLGTASVYGLIFLFVWRHESFMYEKYGNSKMKGNWIRIHATPNSSADRIQLSTKWNPIKKHLSFCNKYKESKQDNDKPSPNNSLNIEPDEDEEQKEAGECDKEEQQQQHRPTRQVQQQKRYSAESLKLSPLQHHQPTQQTLAIGNATLTDMTTSTSCIISNLDRLSCVCLCERNDETHELNQTDQYPMSKDCLLHATHSERIDTTDQGNNNKNNTNNNKCCPKQKINNSSQSRTELSAANLECRRKPHVRTAQTLALVAANFIISYTPYLVYTTIPVQKRQVVLFKEKPHWTLQIRRILFYMYFVNSALNPIIYSCMNRHFRNCMIKFYADLKRKFKNCNMSRSKPLETNQDLVSFVLSSKPIGSNQ